MKKYLLLLSMFLCSLFAGAQTQRGDVNEDGTVDVADVTTLVGIILNGDSSDEGDDEEDVVITPTPSITTSEAVDLGLSVKWATCNVGAIDPWEYGGYYAWGETEEKSDYSWETYKYCNGTDDSMTKYCTDSNDGTVDNKTMLEPADDVATVKWGKAWRMPTKAEQDELLENCTWTWTTLNGVNGYQVTGPSGNSIFLPAAGFRRGEEVYNQGSFGQYWSSTLSGGSGAYFLYFSDGECDWSYYDRNDGRTVRPVCE